MGRARKAAQDLVDKARNGAIDLGHLGIYRKLQKNLHAARERLAGREELLQFDKIRRALDAKVEELTAALQDPSVPDHVAISEGVYKLLRKCQPIYLALNDGLSVKEACDALDDAERTLDDFADQDEKYKKHRKLNGGTVRIDGKLVKLNAKKFAAWQAAWRESVRRHKENPYAFTNQTTEAQIDAFNSKQKTNQLRTRRYALRAKRAREEDEEPPPPPPPNLRMRVIVTLAGNKVKYCVKAHLYKYAPAGYSNGYTTKKKALALAALCEANRPAGTTREEVRDARAQKGLPDGVTPHQGGYKAQVTPKKNTHVRLAAPDGGSVFDTAEAAAKAIKDYEDAGSPTTKSHPLVKYVNRSVY